ncbi:DNA replication licensing factor MCM7, partial [Coemansia sp. S100]
MSALAAIRSVVDYDSEVGKITQFMEKFVDAGGKKQAAMDDSEAMMCELSPGESRAKYVNMLQRVANRSEDTVEISLDDVRTFEIESSGGHPPFAFASSLAYRIENNAKCYSELFSRAIDNLIPEPSESAMQDPEADVLDVLFQARRDRDRRDREIVQAAEQEIIKAMGTDGEGAHKQAAGADLFPAILTRRYSVRFVPRSNQAAQAVRDIGASQIGHLVTVRGIVTRVSDIRPSMVVAAYLCDSCGSEVFQEVKTRQFTPLTQCQSARCTDNRSRGKLH